MLAGKSKCGKTWVVMSLAVSIALGIDWLGFRNCLRRPGRVLIVALEDNRKRINRRLWQVLRGLGLQPNDPRIRENMRISYTRLRLPTDCEEFADELSEDWKPDVVMIDSLSRVMVGSQNNIADTTPFTSAWDTIGVASGAAIGFLHHTNKGWEGAIPSLEDVRGSGDLVAFPRHVVMMKPSGEQNEAIVAMVGNLEVTREPFLLRFIKAPGADGRICVQHEDRGDFERARKRAESKERKAAAKDVAVAACLRRALEIASSRGDRVCPKAKLNDEGFSGAVISSAFARGHAEKLFDLESGAGYRITPLGLRELA